MKTKMVWLLCCLCGTGLMLADEDQQKQNAIVEHITGKVRQEMAKVLAAYREVEVDEMERVLQLDAANARRLKLAARGAADQYSKAAIEGIEHTVVRRLRRESIGTTFGVNEDVITTPDAEAATPFVIFTVSKRPQGVWLASKRPDGSRVSASYLEGDADGSFGPSSLSEQPLWKNTQENILTNEQREEYQDIRERRLKRAVVNAMVAMTSFIQASAKIRSLQATAMTL